MSDRGFPIHSLTAVLDSAYAGAVMTGMQWSLGPDGKVLAYPGTGGGEAGALPTGTGFRHITGGVEDAASQLVSNADVATGAAIVESKLSLNFATHSNANDPATDEKAALAGTSGTPGAGNKYVTDADARNTNARTPSAHAASHYLGASDALLLSDLGLPTASVNFNSQQATNFRIENLLADPVSPTVGQIWLRTNL